VSVCALVIAMWAQDFQWPVTGSITQSFGGGASGRDPGYYYDSGSVRTWYPGYDDPAVDEDGNGYTTGDTNPGWGAPAGGQYRVSWRMHRALDIGVSYAPVRAARAGTAYLYGSTSHFYGYYVVVFHDAGYATLYAHLSSYAVGGGAYVSAGQVIATSGATGFVTGPHLHFEIRRTSNTGNYAWESCFIPSMYATAGWDIPFDYPDIGSTGGPPPSPTGLWHSVLSASDVYFAWSGSPGADGYWVDVTTDPSWSWWWNAPTTATEFTWGGLAPGTTYYWRVYAYNGWGGNHGYGDAFTMPGGWAPAAPTGLGHSVLGESDVYFAWTGSPGAEGYWVDVTTDPSWSWWWNAPTTSTEFTWGGLAPGTTYHWRVYAYNGWGGNHGYGGAFTTPSGGLGTPWGLTPADWQSVPAWQTDVSFDWSDAGGAASYDVVMYYWNGSGWSYYATWTPGESSMSTPLYHGIYYAWTVRARNGAAAGAWAPWAYFYYE